ncbi:Holliday junction resolvase RuvX [bacterium]|nr:Holliday junction resolvase RuvX [bacterium]
MNHPNKSPPPSPNSHGPSAQKVRDFITLIQPLFTTPIQTIDERLTTAQATKELSGFGFSHKELRKKIDSSSACLILQQFLDRQQPLL